MTWQAFTLIFGGIGLFLLGMTFMTDGLTAMAGASLRRLLSSLTRGMPSALATGTLFTAAVQSSTATTMAAIGFVNAGLLTLEQVLGILYGANLGTTLTGWLVSLLGLKISASVFSLPMVGLGAAMRLLGRDRVRSAGLAMAGFGLLFTGIDTMQAGMSGTGRWELFESFTAYDLGGRFVLVGLGTIMTIVTQSSSASFALTLTAVATNTISLLDGAALAIGHNVGTTATAVIATLGATPNAKRAALAHLLFNLWTGSVAFVLLIPLLETVQFWMTRGGLGDPIAELAAFHTVFNVLGVLMLAPLAPRTARFLQRFFRTPFEDLGQPRFLDASVLHLPGSAVEAMDREMRHLAGLVVHGLTAAVHTVREPHVARWSDEAERYREAIANLSAQMADFLERVRRQAATADPLFAQVRVLEHLTHAMKDGAEAMTRRRQIRVPPDVHAADLAPMLDLVTAVLDAYAGPEFLAEENRARLATLLSEADARREAVRQALFRAVSDGTLSSTDGFELANLVTLLHRVVYHLTRAVGYWGKMRAEPEA